MISMIAAIGRDNELGKNNELIWHIPDDMKFFKNTTMGHKVVMGRKTYESLPKTGLPGREMIVISKSINSLENVKVLTSIDEIINEYKDSLEEIFIIGGANIYKQFIDIADCLYLTEIDAVCDDADAYFPEFNKSEWDNQVIEEDNYNDISYKINKYVRRGK